MSISSSTEGPSRPSFDSSLSSKEPSLQKTSLSIPEELKTDAIAKEATDYPTGIPSKRQGSIRSSALGPKDETTLPDKSRIKQLVSNLSRLLKKTKHVAQQVRQTSAVKIKQAAKNLKEELKVNELKTTFHNLKARIAPRKTQGIRKEGDTYIFSKKNAAETAFKNFTQKLTKSLTLKMSKNFFPLYFENEKNKALQRRYQNYQKTLPKLQKKKELLSQSIAKKEQEIADLLEKSDPASKIKESVLNNQIKHLRNKLKKTEHNIARIEVRLYTTIGLSTEIRELEDKIHDFEEDDPEKSAAKATLAHLRGVQKIRNGTLSAKTMNQIDEDIKRLAEFESLNEKGELTRQRLVDIGGTRIDLTTSDGAKLDGIFLDAAKFRQKLHDDGGQFITLQQTGGAPLKGIAFDDKAWNKAESHIIDTLEDLNALWRNDSYVSGWTIVEYVPADGSPNKIVLVPTESLPGKANDQGWLENNPAAETSILYRISASKVTNVKMEDIDTKTSGGTVILSSGIAAVYEQDKDQAAAFLFQGMNVVLFNHRGNGKSEGMPSDSNYQKDIETIYEFTKRHTHLPDSKILFKGLCFGGGPSAFAAGQHPETHLFLEQPFSSFRDVVKEEAKEMMENFITSKIPEHAPQFVKKASKWLEDNLVSLAAGCASLLAPDFNVARSLEKNRGHKAILYIYDDDRMSSLSLAADHKLTLSKHVEENLKAAQKGGNRVKVIATPGLHGHRWLDHQASGGDVYREIFRKISSIKTEHQQVRKRLEEHLSTIEEKIQMKRESLSKYDLKSKQTISDSQASSKQESNINELKRQITDFETQAEKLQSQINAVEKKQEEEIEAIYIGLDQNQMDHALNSVKMHAVDEIHEFLQRAKLSDPILPSS